MASPVADTLDLRRGFWRLADPKISLASIASMFLGACLAAADGAVDWPWLAATVLGILALEVAKNASGEIIDYNSGADLAVAPEDRSPFSGGKRVLVDGLLTSRQTTVIAAASYAVGIAIGLAIATNREPAVLWFGFAGVSLAYFYHGAPVRLSYRGLGELAVAVCYGPLICCGTYLVQRHAVATTAAWSSLPLGLLIAAFLWINEFPDYSADRQSGKRTLVVRLGRRRASAVFAAAAGVILLAAIAVVSLSSLPKASAAGLLAFVPLANAARTLRRYPESTAEIIKAQAMTLFAFLLYAIGTGLGALLD